MDFLTFKTFISPIALIVFYYMGAIVMPIFGWFFSRWLMKKIGFVEKGYQESKKVASMIFSLKYSNYSAIPSTKEGKSPINKSSNASEEETSCLRQVER